MTKFLVWDVAKLAVAAGHLPRGVVAHRPPAGRSLRIGSRDIVAGVEAQTEPGDVRARIRVVAPRSRGDADPGRGAACAAPPARAIRASRPGSTSTPTSATDPWRRLDGTLRSYLRIVYGSTSAARGEIRRLNALHRGIAVPATRRATRCSRCGSTRRSSTRRSSAYDAWLGPLSRARAERFYEETLPIARAFGVPDGLLPKDLDAFEAYMAERLAPGGAGPRHGRPLASSRTTVLHPPLPGLLARLPLDPRALRLDAVAGRRAAAAERPRGLRAALGTARAPRRGLARGGMAARGARSCRGPFRADAAGARRGPPTSAQSETAGIGARTGSTRSTGVPSSSGLQQLLVDPQPVSVGGDVLAASPPRTPSSPSAGAPR